VRAEDLMRLGVSEACFAIGGPVTSRSGGAQSPARPAPFLRDEPPSEKPEIHLCESERRMKASGVGGTYPDRVRPPPPKIPENPGVVEQDHSRFAQVVR